MLRFLTIAGSALLLGAAPQDREAPPGEGVICAWAIYSLMAEVGERCESMRRPPEVQEVMRTAVTKLDAYVRANSEITDEQFDAFKREQALVGAADAEVCEAGKALGMDQPAQDAGPAGSSVDFGSEIDALIARPGEPTWGTCL